MSAPLDDEKATLRLFQDAIRADVHARVDQVMGRLESDIATIHGARELERALQQALTDVSDVMAEGIVAQLREAHRLRSLE